MIQRLDGKTIEKIAAGEIIEGPLSVVKEAVENAIDAGADDISVDIIDGGKKRIVITDNGVGIPKDQVPLAFERHATSKIRNVEDLYQTLSLGFRGEALASILAVAQVTCRTRTEDQSSGYEFIFEEGKSRAVNPVAMSVGTQLVVEDLFYSLPVRKKFMKSDTAEGNKVSRLMYAFAVGNPNISIRYTRESKRIFQTHKDRSLDENLMVLFGSQYFQSLLPIEGKSPHFTIKGRIGNNTFYRGNRQMEFLYINGRYIVDEQIQEVVEDIYKSIIPNGRFPAYQIFIETDAKNLEVNIHPSKQKITYDFPDELVDLLKNLITKALTHKPSLPDGQAENPHQGLFRDLSSEDAYREIVSSYAWSDTSASPLGELNRAYGPDTEPSRDYSRKMGESEPDRSGEEALEVFEDDQEVLDLFSGQEDINLPEKNSKNPDDSLLPPYDDLNFVGILFKTYILLEDRGGDRVFYIDQHAAHERVNYEHFRQIMKESKPQVQVLLEPLTLELNDLQLSALDERKDALEEMGYHFDLFGGKTLLLREIPLLFKTPRDDRIFYDLLDFDIPQEWTDLDDMVDQLAMKACKASVKQGDLLHAQEVEALYNALRSCDYPLTCPHGRPTVIVRTKRDLENRFMRNK